MTETLQKKVGADWGELDETMRSKLTTASNFTEKTLVDDAGDRAGWHRMERTHEAWTGKR